MDSHISHILQVPGCREQSLGGMAGYASMHTVNYLRVSTLSFTLLAEQNGPAKVDNSKIIMVNSCVAFGGVVDLDVALAFTRFCVIETQKVWLVALKLARPTNSMLARVCCDPFLEKDF